MAKWCIGIDLGGTFIKFGLLDRGFKPVGIFQLPTPRNPQGVVRTMVEGSHQLMAKNKVAVGDIVGVGIGSPGPLDIANGVILAMPNIPGMDNLPIRDLVSKGLGLPAVIENDANAAGYGEFLCGAEEGTRDMVLLTLGTGVGGGIVIDGNVIRGGHKIGAEIGHLIVHPGGEPCGCGQKGCLERYASATYIAARARRMIEQDGKASSLKNVIAEKGEIDARDIIAAAKAGDSVAGFVWDQGTYALAVACVSLTRLLDPDEIVFGGGMAKAGDDLMNPLKAHYRQEHWKLTKPMTKLSLARLGNDAGVIGAAGVAWDAFGADKQAASRKAAKN